MRNLEKTKTMKIPKNSILFTALVLILLSGVLFTTCSALAINDDAFFLNVTYVDGEKKYIALTFDDGPHPKYTKKVLDVLEEKGVAATFFVVGFRAELHAETILRMKSLGCEIGNHTYEHINLSKVSKEAALQQLNECNRIIYDITGEYPKIYRPPFGAINAEVDNATDMRTVLWTIDSWDWKCENQEWKVINNVISQAKENSVILMHDFNTVSLAVLPKVIDKLREKGFEFKTVSELLYRNDDNTGECSQSQ